MERVPHILIVEDDTAIARMTAKFLTENGLRVTTASDGSAMERSLGGGAFDLILLDLMLPGAVDGIALCRQVRAQSQIPIIMLTARSEEVDRILGLEIGADDYVTKPFSSRELLARIRAVLRRKIERFDPAPKIKNGSLTFAGWCLDRATRQLRNPDGLRVALTGAEFDLLLALCEHPRRVLNRDQLLDLTQGRASGPFDRSVDTLVSRIRQKIENDPKDPAIIRTVRLGGYFFAPEVQQE
jgi:two-component system OmpR family response regulator